MTPHPINWEAIGVLTGMIGGPVPSQPGGDENITMALAALS